MTAIEDLLKQASDLGARFHVVDGGVQVEGPSPLPSELMSRLRERKSEVRSYILSQREQFASIDLPFPIGCGGLPNAQVDAAEAVNGQLGITEPIHRKYNVLVWVRGFYQDRGEDHGEHYEAIIREQQRLRSILDQGGFGI